MRGKCSEKNVCMTASEAIKEHEKLIRALRGQEPNKLKEEAAEQSRELKKYRKKARKYGRLGKRSGRRGK